MSQPSADSIMYAIQQYYSGSNNPIWEKIQLGTATAQEVSFAYSQIPQMQTVTTSSGRILGVDYADPIYIQPYQDVQDILDSVNSNYGYSTTGGSGFNGNIPINTYGSSGNYTAGGGALTGSGNVLATVADKVSLAAAGTSLGCKIGASIDRALYNIDPEWWDNNYPTINPATWSSIATTNFGKFAIRTLFGTAGDEMTAYISADVLAYTYMMLRDMGAFNTQGDNGTAVPSSADVSKYPSAVSSAWPFSYSDDFYYERETSSSISSASLKNTTSTNPTYIFRTQATSSSHPDGSCFICSDVPFSYTYTTNTYNKTTGQTTSSDTTNTATNYYVPETNRTVYIGNLPYNRATGLYSPSNNNISSTYVSEVADIIINGIRTITPSGIDGITPNSTGTTPDPSVITGTTISDIITQLKQNYPDLFTGSIHTSTLQDDGTLNDDEYIPVPWPSGQTQTSEQTITGTTEQTDTQIDDDTVTDLFPPTTIPNPPDTGTGDGSADVAPTGSASSLWAIYNPTQAQLNSFGSWLWSSNFVEQLKKLFNDPMQAIIGVHKVFATPPTGGSATIVCGYLDSGVSSKTVSNQYTSVDCGTVRVNEYFGNVFDYEPYTKISAYLPFIGVVPLNVSDVMRGSVNITYGVDVITGACLAKINIQRDGAGGILYSYGGSCACHYPISSGSYAGIVSGVLSAAVGIGTSIVSGNPAAAVGGVISGIHQAHTTVEHSGGFTGCAGAMGPKKPYIIIERPQTAMPDFYNEYIGFPSNTTVKISDCSGYTRFRDVHLAVGNAYADELNEIETLLKNGVLI